MMREKRTEPTLDRPTLSALAVVRALRLEEGRARFRAR
jgi:hypothetical protein